MSWKATRNRLFCAGAILLAAFPACAEWQTRAPEKAFVFRNKPVDPGCVSGLVDLHFNIDSPVRLAQCTQSYGPSYYKVLAHRGTRFVVLSGRDDGDGRTTFLAVTGLKDGMLSLGAIFSLQGGSRPSDRCDEGVRDAKVKGHVLRWSQNVTSYGVIAAGGLEWDDAFRDLDMDSCVGSLHMAFDLDRGEINAGWWGVTRTVSMTLKGPLAERRDRQPVYQPCFAALFNRTLTGGRAELNPAGIKAFTDSFLQTCHMKRP